MRYGLARRKIVVIVNQEDFTHLNFVTFLTACRLFIEHDWTGAGREELN